MIIEVGSFKETQIIHSDDSIGWSTNRYSKSQARDIATNTNKKLSALFLPATNCLDVKIAIQKQIINKNSKIILVERDYHSANQIQLFADDNLPNSKVLWSELHKTTLPWKIDYAFIDLFGNLSDELQEWLANQLFQNLLTDSDVFFTFSLLSRGNYFITDLNTRCKKYREDHWNQLFNKVNILLDQNWFSNIITTQIIALEEAIQWSIKKPVLNKIIVYPYRDSKSGTWMSLYHLKLEKSMPKTVTVSQIIEQQSQATTPSERSAATRKMNNYIKKRVEEGKSEKSVRAGIKALMTRKNKN